MERQAIAMKLWLLINRISAWILMACFILFVLTGFDAVRRAVAPQLSTAIHLKYLFIPAQIAFTCHSTYAIHLAIKRWNSWNAVTKAILICYALGNLALIGLYIYIRL